MIMNILLAITFITNFALALSANIDISSNIAWQIHGPMRFTLLLLALISIILNGSRIRSPFFGKTK